MALEYVVTKRVFGFDKDKNEKYVAKSVRSGRVSFSKMCGKVSRLCGVHRKVVDLVVSGLVDMIAEDIDDGKSVQMGEFGIFSPTFVLRVRMMRRKYRLSQSSKERSSSILEKYSKPRWMI